jgi:hypothetical protein
MVEHPEDSIGARVDRRRRRSTRRASGAHVIAGSALISSGVAYRLPHLEGCRRHRDVAHTERGERIEDGADDDRQCRGAAALAAGLYAEGRNLRAVLRR